MKIKLILKENLQPQSLPKNRYNMEVVYKVKKVLKPFNGNQQYLYGWLYPDGTASEIITPQIHGDAMKIIDPNYAEDSVNNTQKAEKIIEQGPIDFGMLTGSIRSVSNGRFHIFTQLTPRQLAWIRKGLAGERLLLFVQHKEYYIPESSLQDWNKALNQTLIRIGAVDFDVLKESYKRFKK